MPSFGQQIRTKVLQKAVAVSTVSYFLLLSHKTEDTVPIQNLN